MYLAYQHCFGTESTQPELCLIPDKPDNFSCVVRIESLRETDCALIRLSPEESIKVEIDRSDGGMVIQAVKPGKLYVTPNLPQNPGIHVRKSKVIKLADHTYEIWFQHDKETSGEPEWTKWEPNRLVR